MVDVDVGFAERRAEHPSNPSHGRLDASDLHLILRPNADSNVFRGKKGPVELQLPKSRLIP